MTAFLPAIAPVALIILIGFIASRFLSLETQSLSEITVYILAPALVAHSLYRTTVSLESATGLILGFLLVSLVIYVIVQIVARMLRLPQSLRTSLLASTLFPNNGNLGLPLISLAFGSVGLERAIIYMIASSVLTFGLGPPLLKGKGLKFGLNLTLKLPLFWAMVLGLTGRLFHVSLPLNLADGVKLLGEGAIPLALVILGIQLAGTKFTIKVKELLGVALRLLLAPLVALIIGTLLQLDLIDLQVLVIQSAMPTAVNTVVLVTEFGGDIDWATRAIVLSTLISFITLPLWLWIVNLG
ncbi:AEC family transporter [Gloeocapsa sp. PCC 73106]|uniref:AEC family transporter n=1 Tax=Gloeocapsa sp. PCC 73106 TaxID=102232 RepID=UPI0002ACEABE|nr:AEC family transporter [Gloeocapsa sp. PCC 73106]ELR97701.1 putative permease [Gloeocapsa sp. PCC 73106]